MRKEGKNKDLVVYLTRFFFLSSHLLSLMPLSTFSCFCFGRRFVYVVEIFSLPGAISMPVAHVAT